MQNTGAMTSNPGYASLCIKCGKCVTHCPQGIPIREKLAEVSGEMEGIFFLPIVTLGRKIMKVKKH